MDYHRPRHVIAQALALGAEQGADDGYPIQDWNTVNDTKQVARHRFIHRDRPAGFLDDTQVHQALARGLAVPDCFEDRKVPGLEEEQE